MVGKARLVIMRHAKSDWETGAESDFDRPLARRGQKDAPRMGRWLSRHYGKPNHIVCSPARRARETAGFVLPELDYPETDVTWDDRIYEGSISDLLGVLADHESCASLMLIGHNPGLDDLLEHLSIKQPEKNRDGKLMTTAAIAILEFRDNKILTVPGSADIDIIRRPREIKPD